MPHILIAEDDADSGEMLARLIAAEGMTAARAGSLREARAQLALRQPDLILLDMQLPDGNGMALFADIESPARTQVVLITGYASLETSIEALRLGATDYLVKPININHLKGILSRVARPADLKAEVSDLREQLRSLGRFGNLWGRSKPMQAVYDQIARVAPTSFTVLITGESGTGKEVVAQSIHELSRRRTKPFLAVNCGAISPQLIESEMFGHEKGSFTGASRQHKGYFERASGGTLFLDEITEMPVELQVKLLRVLETGSFLRVGSDEVVETDVRIVAATNRSPEEAVEAGKLRRDLLYRLNVFPIQLPPLRERIEDVPLLAEHFLAEANAAEKTNKVFAAEALERLAEAAWPGNVRELRNAVQRAFIMAEGNRIDEYSIPVAATAVDDKGPVLSVRVGASIADVERRLILATLDSCAGHKEKCAQTLGISLKTLYNRLRDYGRENGEAEAA